MTTTTTWNAASGNWATGSLWTAGVPVAGDTAVINDATLTLTSNNVAGTLDGVALELNPVNDLEFSVTNVVFDAATSMQMTGPVDLNAIGNVSAAGSSEVGTGTTAGLLNINMSHSAANQPHFTNSGAMSLVGPVGAEVDTSVNINPEANVNATFENKGQISVGVGTQLFDDPNSLNITGGQVINSGTISFRGDGSTALLTEGQFTDPVRNTGAFVVDGGGLLDPSLTEVDFIGALSGTGPVQLRDGTMFESGGDAGGTIQFSADHGVLEVDNATLAIGATLENFGFSDVIRYIRPIASMQYTGTTSSGTLTVHFTVGGSQQLTFANLPSTSFSQNFIASSGNDEVTVACFAGGTRILTGAGEVAVERLRVGDLVATRHGGRLRAVRWIGHRHLAATRPVCVAAHAFGPDMPHRDLVLSADHAVHVDGLLMPVRHLENGATVRRQPMRAVTYYHLELGRHDVVLAEGLPCESYLNTGNRGGFGDADDQIGLGTAGGREDREMIKESSLTLFLLPVSVSLW